MTLMPPPPGEPWPGSWRSMETGTNQPWPPPTFIPEEEPVTLPWFRWPWNRCRAVKPATDGGYFGRCELRRHSPDIDHALERGMDTPRWSTRWTA